MRMRIGAAVPPGLLLLFCALPGRAQTPAITNVNNAAIPAIDYSSNTIQLGGHDNTEQH